MATTKVLQLEFSIPLNDTRRAQLALAAAHLRVPLLRRIRRAGVRLLWARHAGELQVRGLRCLRQAPRVRLEREEFRLYVGVVRVADGSDRQHMV